MNQNDYGDFGHRIEGARKFMFGFTEEEIKEASTPALMKQATRNALWPEPELGAKERFVEFIISKFRSCTRAKVNTNDRETVERYIRQMLAVRGMMEDAQTEEEALEVIRHVQTARDERGQLVFDQKLLFTKRLRVWELTRSQMELELFGVAPEDIPLAKAKNQIKCFPYDGSCRIDRSVGCLTRYTATGTKFYRIAEGVRVMEPDLGSLVIVNSGHILKLGATEEEYEVEVRKLAKRIMDREGVSAQPVARKKKPRVEYEHLKNIVHVGSDYRNGQNVDTEVLHHTFSFYGGQFGNYLPQRERVQVVNMAYDAFCDLAAALSISPEDVSFKGKLSIAFGARGSGRAGAHYELDRRVINLTRINGAGSLSHEWFHGLDHHLSILEGNDAVLLSKRGGGVDALNRLTAKVSDVSSAYRVDCLALDAFEHRRKPYWADQSEMLARAFSTYIIDRLSEKDIRNDYLGYEFEIGVQAGARFASAYPQGQEREEMNGLFDSLFKELFEKNVMRYSESQDSLILPPPVRAPKMPPRGKVEKETKQLSFL